MTSSSLGYSEIEPFTNINNKKTRRVKPPPRREGFTNRRNTKKNVEALIDKLHNVDSMESQLDSEEEGLADFNPPPPPESSGVSRMKERRNGKKEEKEEKDEMNFYNNDFLNDANYNIEPPFEKNDEEEEDEEEEKHIRKEDIIDVKLLLEKMNYVVNMLEEQQLDKSNTFTEEVVLYCFLGVFIIYVIDSFAKVGKYIR